MTPPENNVAGTGGPWPTSSDPLPAGARFAAPLGLAVVALLVRALPATTVYAADRVTFFGMDAYYHMRRVAYGLARFPESLTFDPYINFPHGAKPIWSPLFDTLAAWLALPFYAWGGIDAAESAVVWLPVLLGVGTVLVVYWLALRFFGFAVAVLSGLLLAVNSAHYWYSQLGFLDHHAAVALSSTVLLACTMFLLRELETSPQATTGSRWIVATGLAIALAFLVWPGSLLHVALAEAGILLYLASRQRGDEATRAAAALFWLNALAAVCVAPFTWGNQWPQWNEFSPTVLSNFQPWFLAALALYALVLRWMWTRRANRDRLRRLGDQVFVAALLAGASLLLFPDLLESAGDAWQWLSKDEAFQASVAESRPLLILDGQLSFRIAEGRLSRFIYLLPLALFVLLFSARTRADRSALAFLVLWTAGLVVVTLLQRRFFNSLSVAMAIAMAWSLVCLYRGIAGRAPKPNRQVLGVLASAVVAFFLLAPMFDSYARPLDNLGRAIKDQPVIGRNAGPNFPALLETAEWIRDNTPETSGFLDASRQPEYAVLALSGNGHLIEYVGERPTITNNFGDDIGRENYRRAQRYFATPSEAEAEAIANELGARYVVATLAGPRKARTAPLPMLRRLADQDGQGLGGHRLVFEAKATGPGARPSDPTPKVFERVTGAIITGRAQPGEPVSAELEFRTNRGRRVLYRTRTAADENGLYRLRVPYASDPEGPSPATAESYRVRSRGKQARIAISEQQVQAGNTVKGPDFGS